MGQEIDRSDFDVQDFARFHDCLAEETRLLADLCASGRLSSRGPLTGFELEAWLVDDDMHPAPVNAVFLERLADPMASPELARFNVEFNTTPLPLESDVLSRARGQFSRTWQQGEAVASQLGVNLLAIGTLPTLTKEVLNVANLSAMRRYQALNQQVLAARENRPIALDIVGHQRLHCEHHDVMLEAGTTSFQIHWQLPCGAAIRGFNASLLMSAPMVAVGANSPFLFGHDLWAETRIPLFEQAVAVG
ncbi:MAG: uncharacterized protein H6R26_2200, partial [Proteobacteria bacterium]|nr:uncharacterized protein [Pseudomonadota bacterium]